LRAKRGAMTRPSRATLAILASGLALVAVLTLAVGPHRSALLVKCGVERSWRGGERDLDDVVVQLPPSWCDGGRDHPRGTSELRTVRVPHSRSSRNALAIVRRVDFELSREAVESAMVGLEFETPEYGQWQATRLTDIELGGRPGYEIRFERSTPSATGHGDEVAADFMVPDLHVWVECAPMSAEDLAQCRAIAASAKTSAAAKAN
jgi:hypothetical protein